MTDRQSDAEDEFLAEMDDLADPKHPTWPGGTPVLSPSAQEHLEASLRRINSLAVSLTVVFFLLVLPLTFFMGLLGGLGACYNGCSDFGEAMVAVGFALVPIGYVVLSIRYVRANRRAVQEDPLGTKVISPGSIAAVALMALLFSALALVVTCFGLIGLLG